MSRPRVVDAHVHAGHFGEHFPRAFAAEMMANTATPAPESLDQPLDRLIAVMDEARVDVAFLLALDVRRTAGVKVPNDVVANAVARYPGRFIGFASVDPVDPGSGDELDHALNSLGLRGVKLAPCYLGLSPADPACDAVYERAAALDVPVLVHVGYTPASVASTRFFPPHPMAKVAGRYPGLQLIMAHLGAPWVTQSLRLMAEHPNLWADLSIYGWYQPAEALAASVAAARQLGVLDRLMWASDSPFAPVGDSLARVYALNKRGPLAEDPLTDTEVVGLTGGSAERLIETRKEPCAEP